MDKDDIIKLAREAGWDMDGIFNDVFGFGVRLERFAALVAAREREACAALPAAQPCPTCEALARTVMLDQTSHDTQRQPLTDKQILADETLRYYFGQNGGAGPVSKQGRKVVDAIEAAHGIGEKT